VTALGILSVSFGAPIITIVALKPIASEFGNVRSVPALSYSLAWLGSAIGGIAMGQVAERIGVRWTVVFGALMIAAGLVLSSIGGRVSLYVGHGLLMGLLGNAGLNAPLYVYVARWFDRRRGTALALIASGQAVAGTIWAPLFGHAIEAYGWRHTMRLYAVGIAGWRLTPMDREPIGTGRLPPLGGCRATISSSIGVDLPIPQKPDPRRHGGSLLSTIPEEPTMALAGAGNNP
jgi:MFS family permease